MRQLASYFKEVEDFDSIITEEGFAAYRINGEECYIKHIWVDPDTRSKNIASEIADDIAAIAKRKGCKYLTGSVFTKAQNPTASAKVLLAYGFSIHSAFVDGIIFRKDL